MDMKVGIVVQVVNSGIEMIKKERTGLGYGSCVRETRSGTKHAYMWK